jgi:ATP-grasp in the biosynthetic pathway with Ter operon
VRLVRTPEEAEYAFDSLSAPPGVLRTIKRTLVDKDMRLLGPCLQRSRAVVSVQKVVEGSEANCAVSCWQGRVLGCISVEVLKRADLYGPATVVRLIDNRDMLAAAEKLARRFQLSGLFGLDFILEAATGKAYLLEMNARATQTCHLEMGAGRNLIEPLACELLGMPHETSSATSASAPDTIPETIPDTIALFPAEWKRDPASRFIKSGFHDVPWEEPALIRYCLRSRLQDLSWMAYRKWRARKAALKEAELPGAALIESRRSRALSARDSSPTTPGPR